MGQKILFFYILGMTLLTFNVCGADKFAAQRQRRRVPEKVLFLLSALGGSVGMYLGMFTFRHKTKHWYFVVGIPLIILVQAAILFYFWLYFFGRWWAYSLQRPPSCCVFILIRSTIVQGRSAGRVPAIMFGKWWTCLRTSVWQFRSE